MNMEALDGLLSQELTPIWMVNGRGGEWSGKDWKKGKEKGGGKVREKGTEEGDKGKKRQSLSESALCFRHWKGVIT